MADVTFEIRKHLGTLEQRDASKPNQFVKEINLISWNDAEPKFDIRAWNSDHTKMSKGITLTGEELKNLYDIIGTALSD